jgi:hypothetical protein
MRAHAYTQHITHFVVAHSAVHRQETSHRIGRRFDAAKVGERVDATIALEDRAVCAHVSVMIASQCGAHTLSLGIFAIGRSNAQRRMAATISRGICNNDVVCVCVREKQRDKRHHVLVRVLET